MSTGIERRITAVREQLERLGVGREFVMPSRFELARQIAFVFRRAVDADAEPEVVQLADEIASTLGVQLVPAPGSRSRFQMVPLTASCHWLCARMGATPAPAPNA